MILIILRIIAAFFAVGLLGMLFGTGLAFAARLLAVKKNKKLMQLEEALPGLNCGACGYAGCSGYAEALLNQEEENIKKCAPGGEPSAAKLAQILEMDVDYPGEKMVAQVHCAGTDDLTKAAFEYQGLEDCNAAALYFSGNKACKYACLGMGSCIKVCPVNAIKKTASGRIWIDRDICVACGKCLEVCPSNVIKMIPYSARYIVACNSHMKAKEVKAVCKAGCIGCKICQVKHPGSGFEVDNFLAHVEKYDADERIQEGAVKACPVKVIIKPHVKFD